MSVSEIAVKRLRRQWEPEEKTWNDEALELPWEELSPPLHKATTFALKNVFFFSHATSVQSRTISVFRDSGNSAIVEAPTGSGKTLAVLIPLMERTVWACEAYVTTHNCPLLRRDIIGIILSPSRVLAEQTFVVGRNLSSRYPHAIRFALCDGAMQSAAAALEGIKTAARGAGTFLVTTPHDLVDFITAWEADCSADETCDDMQELLAEQDEETRRRYYEKHKNSKRNGVDSGFRVQLRGCHEERFVLIVDEADLIFHSDEMRSIVTEFIATYGRTEEPQQKRRRITPKNSSSLCMKMDVAFVGATVSTSSKLQEYALEVSFKLGSTMHTVVLNKAEDFVTRLQNRYVVCGAYEFLPLFIQLMNIHASKKHFIFFNSAKTLKFVQKLFSILTENDRPLLYIKHIYVMYEGMSERSRLEQYNAFLNHQTDSKQQQEVGDKKKKITNPLSAAEKKNQVYISGWKRDGRQPHGKGALLLCTDMAAFGLDVRDVDYVYHFEPPTTVQSYVHRIGRVGRMGMRGSSILILPCFNEMNSLSSARERKTNSGRFDTLTNTKRSTADIQMVHMSTKVLSKEKQEYLQELGCRSELHPHTMPPFAPITSTIRNVISQNAKLKTLAQAAAMSMCAVAHNDESAKAWFDPALALHSILLD
ncbi:Helicase [Trypanosoma melophagium]|uniref:Helicase n=1 Tax=Trypanosoma melophagium TaxID=715481 RepID=UPI00351A0FFF|nr:Helicase [Trypanosoma melophagium]